MNQLFGKQKQIAMPTQPPPPPPPPVPLAAVAEADERRAGDRARKASGAQNTLLTAGKEAGDTTKAPVQKKTLLGQ